jgi:hypothetical protein
MRRKRNGRAASANLEKANPFTPFLDPSPKEGVRKSLLYIAGSIPQGSRCANSSPAFSWVSAVTYLPTIIVTIIIISIHHDELYASYDPQTARASPSSIPRADTTTTAVPTVAAVLA